MNREKLCSACESRPAHPEAFGLCEVCDDLPGLHPLGTRPEDDAVTEPEGFDPWAEGLA